MTGRHWNGISRRQFSIAGAGLAAGIGLRAAGAQAQDSALETLIKAAQREGQLLFYGSPADAILRRIAQAFSDKYGIRADFLRIVSGNLRQRFSAEAQAGTFAADLIVIDVSGGSFVEAMLQSGWVTPITQANLPILESGGPPPTFLKNSHAIVQLAPWQVGYNTRKVDAADVPKDWPDILNPRFKGQILIPDFRSSDAYTQFWAAILDRHGPDFFARLRNLDIRIVASASPAFQSLAAGEVSLVIPSLTQSAVELINRGAPIALQPIPYTTGSEIGVVLPNVARTRHPNAARLMANFIISPEGNAVMNAEPGSISIYDRAKIPAEYRFGDPKQAERREEIINAFGQR